MKTAVDAYVQSVALFELFIRDENKENVRWVALPVSPPPESQYPPACSRHDVVEERAFRSMTWLQHAADPRPARSKPPTCSTTHWAVVPARLGRRS
jgi:hypothetical protein